jgi:hypothetical protein
MRSVRSSTTCCPAKCPTSSPTRTPRHGRSSRKCWRARRSRCTRLTKDVPAELLAICERAMEREPKQRYASMTDLASDLRAYLEHRVVSAYETGALAEMKKWVQRNKGLASAAAALIVVLAGATVVVANKNREVEAKNVGAWDRAEHARSGEARRQRSKREQKPEVEARKAEFDHLSGVSCSSRRREPMSFRCIRPSPRTSCPCAAGWEPTPRSFWRSKSTLLQTVANLEARALPQTDAERDADRTSHPKLEELRTKRAERESLATSTLTNESAKSLESFDTAIAALEAEIAKRRTWTFADESQLFLHSTLSALLSDLATFEADTVAGVQRRLTLGGMHRGPNAASSARSRDLGRGASSADKGGRHRGVDAVSRDANRPEAADGPRADRDESR